MTDHLPTRVFSALAGALLLLLVPFGTGERLYRFLAKRRPRARASRGGDHP